jgi:hypothetical protein
MTTFDITEAAEARAKFDETPGGRLIDWQGVTQTDYMAFEVEIREVVQVRP